MPSIDYTFIPNQEVFVITTATDGALSVRAAVVLRFKAEAVSTGVKSSYDVRYEGQASNIEVTISDIFGTLSEAISEYEARLS